jgi:glyoxylase-like metal-dependent hydrolase (beta-lactamase superfamily II)
MTEVGTRDIPPLKWDVFVTPGIPIATNDLPPGTKQGMFQAISSTLIYGKRDAVLVDAFMTVKQADALVDWVAASGKNLTTIYITHSHGDHFFGIGALLDRFPNARAVATPDIVRLMRHQVSPEFLESFWKAGFPGQIPSVGLVVAGDAAYNDVHLYLAESNAQTRREWISALDKIESLNPRAVIAGHKRPENDDSPRIVEETRQYIRDFDRLAETTTTAQELYDKMLELYPDRVNPGWALWNSTRAVKL